MACMNAKESALHTGYLLLRLLTYQPENCMQVLFLGGLFTQFSLDSAGNFVVDQGGVRAVPAVQMAIDRINNKSDSVYDGLLPNTQVRCHNCRVIYIIFRVMRVR